MKSTRLLPVLLLTCSPLFLKAQTVFEEHPPIDPNIRVALDADANGGTNGDDFSGFEVGYASEIYPLDQMVISYGYGNPDDNAYHRILYSLEEFYPLTETFKLYGVAGLGYMWTDFSDSYGDSNGWYGKIGGGAIMTLNDSFDLYAELAYLASNHDIWMDGDNGATSENWNALLGFRFKY